MFFAKVAIKIVDTSLFFVGLRSIVPSKSAKDLWERPTKKPRQSSHQICVAKMSWIFASKTTRKLLQLGIRTWQCLTVAGLSMICTLFPHKCDCYNSICKVPTTFSIVKRVLLQRFWGICNLFCKNTLLCAENLFGNTLHIEDCSRNLQTIVLWDNYTSKHPTVQVNLQFCLQILTDRIFISIINITICGKVQTIWQ